jgi:ADP-ribose pyrophosphatase YjhB (NUDIX family)
MNNMKKLTVVFPYFKNPNGKVSILLGRNHKLKKLNGFGGKVNEGESVVDGAIRELEEELKLKDIDPEGDNFQYFAKIVEGDKQIFAYLLELSNDDVPNYNQDELYDLTWYNLSESDTFVGEMLSGDNLVINALKSALQKRFEGKDFSVIEVNKTGNAELQRQTKNMFK